MSRRHAWLRFVAGGPPLPHRPAGDPTAWQHGLGALHARWYDGAAPPSVAAVFVLQWVLQVPAHTAAHAAAAGPWRARLTDLTFSLGGSLVPDVVRLTALVADAEDLAGRLDAAEADYRAVATPLAEGYPAPVRLGPHVRAALVDDMWAAARREAEGAAGVLRPGVLPRASCCLIYALPGCVECAGCPRLLRP
ncbi:(2Fe-2S)-binding protein [Phycicoccus sonneratiae]|uniref:(2Fe-2S)-binding protein n=1 Tax=Phycicoccus sonneratiae TaxID=2807628 RepID=A0ABS2CNB9_9MICO|nr:(2Fe-2S)-binding protein [Phycicoccus sonneraticus]MBM6401310.1 (2Fe-2S)-binding protein [Phycicoccus sonneraticus]